MEYESTSLSLDFEALFCTGTSKSNKTGNNSLNRTSRDCKDDGVGAEDCVKKDSTNSFNSTGSSGFASSCSGGGATQDMEALAGVCSLLLSKTISSWCVNERVLWCAIKVRVFYQNESCLSCPHPPLSCRILMKNSHFDRTLSTEIEFLCNIEKISM